ncbi:MAG: response regulator [Proteobacteria bacterium]|nr:response regulator [Pseudomonadota bacterium]
MKVLLVAKDITQFSALEVRLKCLQEMDLVSAATGDAGLSQLKSQKIDLVIVNEQLADMSGIAFVKQLVRINPLANTAIVSALTDEEFHEATEGLGVLMQLPPQTQEKDAEALLSILEKIGVLLQPMAPQPQKATKP